jgi:serine/threonine protein kinase
MAPQLAPGVVLPSGHVLGEQLGSGGMGIVFRASHPDMDREVVVKILREELMDNPIVVARFHDEVTLAQRIRHRGVVAVLDHGELRDGRPFIVMERAPGVVLSRLVHEHAVSPARAVAIVHELLAAVGAVHAHGVIHGDIKSDNILVDPANDDRVTLIDFGVARLIGCAGTPNLISGTPEYMAPELASGNAATVASDMYAVGVVAYELVAGALPFTGGTPTEVIARHADDPVVPPSLRQPDAMIPPGLDDAIERWRSDQGIGFLARPRSRPRSKPLRAASVRAASVRRDDHSQQHRPARVRSPSRRPRGTGVDSIGCRRWSPDRAVTETGRDRDARRSSAAHKLAGRTLEYDQERHDTAGPRRSNTGHGAMRTTDSATLPIIKRLNPRRPCVPMTMRSAPTRLASASMTIRASPTSMRAGASASLPRRPAINLSAAVWLQSSSSRTTDGVSARLSWPPTLMSTAWSTCIVALKRSASSTA